MHRIRIILSTLLISYKLTEPSIWSSIFILQTRAMCTIYNKFYSALKSIGINVCFVLIWCIEIDHGNPGFWSDAASRYTTLSSSASSELGQGKGGRVLRDIGGSGVSAWPPCTSQTSSGWTSASSDGAKKTFHSTKNTSFSQTWRS